MTGAWINRDLGELATVTAGNSAPQDETLFADGTVPFFRTSDVGRIRFGDIDTAIDYLNERGTRGMRQFPKGTILFPKSGASTFLNHRVMMQVDGCVSSHLATITADRKLVEPRFLLYFLSTVQAQDLVQDHAYPSLNLPLIAGIKIPTPPLTEQRRIVAILDEAFEGIATAKANAEKNLQNARELCEELMQGLFPEEGDISADAPSLNSLCDLIVDCEHKTAPTQEHGIPSIRTPNIGRGRLLLDGVYRVSDETYKEWTRRAEPQAGDLILAREAPAGNVAVIPEGTKVCLGQRTVLIRPRKAILEPDYLAQLLLRRSSQQRLLAHSRGATVQHINLKDIRAFKIAAIPSLAEQRNVVEQVNELFHVEDRLVDIYGRKIAALDELKKSLLHQAFTGQL
jgi:type I restriction enzyme, S subunit